VPPPRLILWRRMYPDDNSVIQAYLMDYYQAESGVNHLNPQNIITTDNFVAFTYP
jgi:transposase